MPRSLLGLLQVVVIAKILIYLCWSRECPATLDAGDRLYRGHYGHRVVVPVVLW